MLNLDELTKQLNAAVRDAVAVEAEKLHGETEVNALIKSILDKPVLQFPDDVQTVLRCGRTTVFELAKSPDWPRMTKRGQKQYLRTDAFLDFLAPVAESGA